MGSSCMTHEDQMLFEARIDVSELSVEEHVRRVIDDYDTALDTIAGSTPVHDIYYFGITISLGKGLVKMLSTGVALRAVRAMARARNVPRSSARNPWKALGSEFWLAASAFPSLHDRLLATLDKIENVLANARLRGSANEGLHEDETTAFAEPLVSLLALQDIRFVDAYRRCMNQWDMDSEVDQLEIIDLIIRVHDLCPDTERLLYDRATISAGKNGETQIEDLYPLLEKAYGRFTGSALFKEIIAWLHAADMEERGDAYTSFREMESKMPDPVPRPRNAPPFFYSGNADLKTAAAKMFAELDQRHPLAGFLSM